MSKQNGIKTVSVSLVIGLLSGVVGGIFANRYLLEVEQGNGEQRRVIEERVYVEESDSIEAIGKVSPSVVSIVATRDLRVYRNQLMPFEGGFMIPQVEDTGEVRTQKIGGGTGFIITNDGYVLTNKHVVSDQEVDYTIVLNDGTEYGAEFVSADPFYDIAVVKLVVSDDDPEAEAKRNRIGTLAVTEFGDSEELQVGQKVFAIGNALAEYENTVTAGIVSAKGREIVAGGSGVQEELLSGLVQTDAAINPGNSGGPLVNLDGQVIGVNVAIDQVARSVGFAIPINDVKPILESIKRYGKIVRPILGVRYMILDEAQADELQIDVQQGALLVGDDAAGRFAVIPGGPAEKAGLKVKDVILEVDGKKIGPDYSLQRAIQDKQPGDQVKLKIWRSGEEIDVELELGREEI